MTTTSALPPLTIHYEECAFTFPWSENRQDIHKQVYHTVLDGKNISDDKKTRAFLYDAIALDAEGELGIATVRGSSLPEHLETASATLTVKTGQTLNVMVTVSASRKRRNDLQKFTERITDEGVPEWAQGLLERNAGVSASDITLINRHDYRVRKAGSYFIVPAVKIKATVTVKDSTAFARSFLNGLGAQKGYGVGLIEIEGEAR